MLKPSRRHALLSLAAVSRLHAASDICFMTATELTRLIRARKLSPKEVLDAHLKQIERVNPKINAIVTQVAAETAMMGPLHGLPIAHKDLVNTKGIRTTFGSPLFKDFIPGEDDLIVKRIRAAGAVLIGKTNTPEFGAGSQTFNTVFGATLNPYDLTKTCGGSSGGAAAALASGMLPIADGSDLGGSLRNPAAFCNVVGFRPSPGRVPNPGADMGWSPLSTSGPMARTVADVALLLSAIAGPDPGAPLSLPEPGASFLRPLGRDFKGVRVAWFKNLGGIPFDPRISSVIDGHRKTFESLGCIVEQDEPDFSGADDAFKTLRAWGQATQHGERYRSQPGQYKDTLALEIEQGLKLSAADVARAERLHTQLFRRFQGFLDRYEYFILPTTQSLPFDVKTPYPTSINGVKFESYVEWMKACWYITITGSPAISVPAGFSPEGLPVGIQIVGRYGRDWSVLQLASAFENATRFGARHPGLGLA